MSWFYRPYVSVAERKAKALKKVAAMKKKGQTVEPVTAATPRGKMALSFWGEAWCDHLESYSDFANRLPRGRTYLRNGSVLHLGIDSGRVEALVMGSELYKQTVRIAPLPKPKWNALKRRCQGKIGSLVELLQGKISGEIMRIVTDRKNGLFPGPREIKLSCSCPDWAGLCKHLAAILYGVGARLDDAPELLFKLRGVDHNELIQADASALAETGRPSAGRRTLAPASLGDVFGIDLDDEEAETPPVPPLAKKPRKTTGKTPRKKSAPADSVAKKAKARTTKKPAKKSISTDDLDRRRQKILRELDRLLAATRKKPRKKKAALKKPPRQRQAVKEKATPAKQNATKKVAPFKPTAAAVRKLREDLGLSRAAFSKRLRVSPQTVANWEGTSGPINPQFRSLAALRALHRKTRE